MVAHVVTHLVQLKADKTGNKRRRSRNGGDDLARDLLRSVTVRGVNAVVERTQVRRGGDEINVVVRVVVLLELYRGETVANER